MVKYSTQFLIMQFFFWNDESIPKSQKQLFDPVRGRYIRFVLHLQLFDPQGGQVVKALYNK